MEELSLTEPAAPQAVDRFQIDIVDASTQTLEGDTHTVYHLQIKNLTTEKTQLLKKRFSSFNDLHELLVKHYSAFWLEAGLPPFPPKTLTKKLSPEVVSERKVSLEKWLRGIYSLPHVWNCFFVQSWLELLRMDGKVVVITGASSGLGFATAKLMALMGAHVVMGCRSEEKAKNAIHMIQSAAEADVHLTYLPLNLSSLSSVQQFAQLFKEKELKLHYLILNAGVIGVEGLTKDGFEASFGINYVANFYLTQLLLPILESSKPARIISLVSENHMMGDSIDYTSVNQPTLLSKTYESYNFSKLALNTWTIELARRTHGHGVTANCIFPGYCGTNFYRELPEVITWLVKSFTSNPQEVALKVAYCALSTELEGLSGLFIGSNAREEQHCRFALKPENGATLWAISEAWIHGYTLQANKKDQNCSVYSIPQNFFF